jgi:DNA modification methylase
MTELIWDGKYDVNGKKAAPLRVALPFQTVETVNESAQERQRMLDLFSAGRDPEWRNRLIWGDKKYVLPSLLEEFAGKVNLTYIDPPFNVGADFSFTTTISPLPEEEGGAIVPGKGELSFTKEPSVIEQKAYRDTWGRGLDSYLQWFYETAMLLRELLAEDGSIYVHLDWHIGHYAKVVLDEVIGKENFRNEIIWHYPGREMHIANKYNAKHDVIMFYAKSEATKIKMADVAIPYDKDERLKGLRRKVHTDDDGREWVWETRGQASGQEPYKRYVDEIISQGRPLSDVWDDLQFLRGNHPERVDYSTQKPSWLLERLIKASSNEGDLVLDCFCGSGTTAAVAEKLNRRWITCDLGRFAIHTARKRLLSIPNVRPFVVQNLGKYERQAWQAAEFSPSSPALHPPGEGSARRAESPSPGGRGNRGEGELKAIQAQRAYTDFILKLYNARPVNGYTWLHGLKGGRMVHVGAVDAPVALGDITQIVAEFKKAVGTGADAPSRSGVDVLGWDFAFELNEVARQQAAAANLNLKFVRIPNDVMDRRAVEQGDIRFFELAALGVEVKKKGRAVSLTLTDFVIPPDDVPEDVQRAVKHWSQWIDYWAVDWDYREDTFHNQWQAFRTRQSTDLQKTVAHTYDEPGEYMVVVKVIDILGNDTTKTLTLKVK